MTKSESEFIEPSNLTTLDRSSLERWSICPAQARIIEAGNVNTTSAIATAGGEGHDALSRTICEFFDSNGQMGAEELRNSVWAYVMQSRPDVQPDAIRGIKASVWAWSKLVAELHFLQLMKFDGGSGERSGQISADLEELGLRVTTELDLLYSTPSKEVVVEVDYKTGHFRHRVQDIADSFQFNMHAWLIFENFETVNCVQLRVWNTRLNDLTYLVEFKREDLHKYACRIREAGVQWMKYHAAEVTKVPGWPEIKKCSDCAVSSLCHVGPGRAVDELNADPGGYVDSIVALQARLDAMTELADAYVRKTNNPIVSTHGNCFGFAPPKRATKPKTSLYQQRKDEDDAD